LRGVERPAGQNDLLRGVDLACLTRLRARRVVRLVETRALETLHADGAVGIVEEKAGREGVDFDRQIVGIFSSRGINSRLFSGMPI
jgi:hypothetical protein